MQAAKKVELGDGTWLEVLSEKRNELLKRLEVEALAEGGHSQGLREAC